MPTPSTLPPRGGVVLRTLTRNVARAGIVSLHGLLLWQRCADATILEPLVLAKYLGAVLLLAGAFAYRRLAPARLQGRRAVLVFWLVVAMLHLVAPFSAETRNLEAEIVAFVELGLGLPLALAFFVLAGTVTPSLRALHRIGLIGGIAALAPRELRVPARAPPCAC